MLECKLCDYLKEMKCEFTGHIFVSEDGFDTNEYPCRNFSFEDYLASGVPGAAVGKSSAGLAAGKGSSKRVYHMADEFWHFLYLKRRRCDTTAIPQKNVKN